MYISNNDPSYFESFGIEHVPKEIRNFIGNKNIEANIYKIEPHNSIMCGYFCISFIDLMLTGKNLLDYSSLFLPYDFKKNDNIILKYIKKHKHYIFVKIILRYKMDKTSGTYPNLSDQTKFRSDKIIKPKTILLLKFMKEKQRLKE